MLVLLMTCLPFNIFAQEGTLKARYLMLPYDLIPDEQVSITPADITLWKSRVNFLKTAYYISVPIDFTSRDSTEAYNALKLSSKNFANNFQDTSLFSQNGGQNLELNPPTNLPYLKTPIGTIVHFIKDDHLYVSKITGKKQVADSVRVRHLLLYSDKKQKASEILKDLKSNQLSWDLANKKYNQDSGGAENEGDIGYITKGMTVESFDKLCFEIANVGEYHQVETPFGIHIIQVLDKKFSGNSYSLQTQSFVTPLIPGPKTLESAKTKAKKLIGKSKNLDELKTNLTKKGVELNEFPPYLYPSNEIAQWVQNAKHGEITLEPLQIYDNNDNKNKFFILGVSSVSAISDEEFLNQMGYAILKEKKEKILLQKVKAFNSLEEIAKEYDLEIQEITLPPSEIYQTPDEMIFSKDLQDQLYKYKENELTPPIIGFNGIYRAYILWKK